MFFRVTNKLFKLEVIEDVKLIETILREWDLWRTISGKCQKNL